ncbi:Uncharacterised protein [Sphingobacterium thalpophilum]|uniref:Uncharacterized protein n=1 Tax=Sphingobacterium thalpophilum TaxID=259 RepID=A0A4U9VTL7_9SPHI|nr:Uncharacterised protein [Sphingobacterium thalpophilum]
MEYAISNGNIFDILGFELFADRKIIKNYILQYLKEWMGIGIEDTRYRGFMLSSWTSKDIQKRC